MKLAISMTYGNRTKRTPDRKICKHRVELNGQLNKNLRKFLKRAQKRFPDKMSLNLLKGVTCYTLRRSWVHNMTRKMMAGGKLNYKLIIRKCRWKDEQMAIIYSMQNSSEMNSLFKSLDIA